MRIYVAGPIGSDLLNNATRGIDAAEKLFRAGHAPYLPHLSVYWHLRYFHDYHEWLAFDSVWLKQCEAVVRLEGESPGADAEVRMAHDLGLPVYSLTEALAIAP